MGHSEKLSKQEKVDRGGHGLRCDFRRRCLFRDDCRADGGQSVPHPEQPWEHVALGSVRYSWEVVSSGGSEVLRRSPGRKGRSCPGG